MGFANVRSARSYNNRQNYKFEKLHTDMAYCCINTTTTKCDHVSLFVGSKKVFLIRLHSSTFVYTRLHSPTFVCDSSIFVQTRLHLSSELVCVFRIDPFLCILLLFSAPYVRLMCTDYKIKARLYISTLQRNFQSRGARNLFLIYVNYNWFLNILRLLRY